MLPSPATFRRKVSRCFNHFDTSGAALPQQAKTRLNGALFFLILSLVLLWPTLLRLPVKPAQATNALIARFVSAVMATSGSLVVLLGIVRGTLLGPIKSFSFLFGSSYGITWLVALAVSVILIIWGGLVGMYRRRRIIAPG
jgi:hypothetical protein